MDRGIGAVAGRDGRGRGCCVSISARGGGVVHAAVVDGVVAGARGGADIVVTLPAFGSMAGGRCVCTDGGAVGICVCCI